MSYISLAPVSDEVNDTSMLGDERRDIVNIDTWKKKADVTYSCQCQEVRQSGYTYARYVFGGTQSCFASPCVPTFPLFSISGYGHPLLVFHLCLLEISLDAGKPPQVQPSFPSSLHASQITSTNNDYSNLHY